LEIGSIAELPFAGPSPMHVMQIGLPLPIFHT
jgi:hypothetical protein